MRNAMTDDLFLPRQEIVFSLLIFAALSVIQIWPPSEFVQAGLTLENLLSGYLGDPRENVIDYQCRKITINIAFVGVLPLLYTICMWSIYALPPTIFSPNPEFYIQYVAGASLLILLASINWLMLHWRTGFAHLSQMRRLNATPLQRTEILNEYRQMATNFEYSTCHSSKMVVTDHWLIVISRYDFRVVRLSDVSFLVTAFNEFPLNPNGTGPMQIIRVRASVAQPHHQFEFSLNAQLLSDLERKLGARIPVSEEVQLAQSLIEKFVDAFVSNVRNNPTAREPIGEDMCFACSVEPPNVKISVNCSIPRTEEEQLRGIPGHPRIATNGVVEPPCGTCQCRPQFCVNCMARIFQAKQPQDHPEVWLDGRCTCPTCRAIFCLRDLCLIE